jgi:hypothetical protein
MAPNHGRRNRTIGAVEAAAVIICTIGLAALTACEHDISPQEQLAPEHSRRRALLYAYQDWFISHGSDLQCYVMPDDDTHAMIVGPAVNRVFVRSVLRSELRTNLKQLGFRKLTFWSGKSTDPSREFVDDYDLTE